MRTHRDLKVWQAARELVVAVYQLTDRLPKQEVFALSSQMRRAAISIPANLAEGAARGHRKEFSRFVHVTRGSVAELQTYLELLPDLGLCPGNAVESVLKLTEQVGQMLTGLASSLQRKQAGERDA